MARSTRSGLGRGLNSLLGGSTDSTTSSTRTTDRERIVYDEREDIVIEASPRTEPGRTGEIDSIRTSNESQRTRNTGSFQPV